jgi:hypothetical protein
MQWKIKQVARKGNPMFPSQTIISVIFRMIFSVYPTSMEKNSGNFTLFATRLIRVMRFGAVRELRVTGLKSMQVNG